MNGPDRLFIDEPTTEPASTVPLTGYEQPLGLDAAPCVCSYPFGPHTLPCLLYAQRWADKREH